MKIAVSFLLKRYSPDEMGLWIFALGRLENLGVLISNIVSKLTPMRTIPIGTALSWYGLRIIAKALT